MDLPIDDKELDLIILSIDRLSGDYETKKLHNKLFPNRYQQTKQQNTS